MASRGGSPFWRVAARLNSTKMIAFQINCRRKRRRAHPLLSWWLDSSGGCQSGSKGGDQAVSYL
jgi:hypothetical protein